MKFARIIALGLILAIAGSSLVTAQDSEQDIVDRYLTRKPKTEKAGNDNIGWLSGSFSVNRINKNNPYNSFAIAESSNIQGGSLLWLDKAFSFGGDVGFVFGKKFYASVGGEYWLSMKNELAGDFLYTPTSSTITNPTSQIKVYGMTLGAGYFLTGAPNNINHVNKLAVKIGAQAGYYVANWDLWPEYSNLNLSTNTSTGVNTTFRGTTPGFTLNLSTEYPTNLWGLVAVIDMNYLMLNFDNVAWYNSQDEEVVVTLDGTESTRVDLDLSGIRGKFELKRYFSW